MGIENMQNSNTEDGLTSQEEEGVTPEMEKARGLNILTPWDEVFESLELKAEIQLRPLGDDKKDAKSISTKKAEKRDPVVEVNAMIIEGQKMSKENGTLNDKIAELMLGHDSIIFQSAVLETTRNLQDSIYEIAKEARETTDYETKKKKIAQMIELEEVTTNFLNDLLEEVKEKIEK